MADDLQRQLDATKALERATQFREQAEQGWRKAIADAYEAGVPRDTILEAAGASDALEVQEYLRTLAHARVRRPALGL